MTNYETERAVVKCWWVSEGPGPTLPTGNSIAQLHKDSRQVLRKKPQGGLAPLGWIGRKDKRIGLLGSRKMCVERNLNSFYTFADLKRRVF